MNIEEIKNKKNQLKLRCHDIINSAKTEIREMTEEEAKEFEANKAEIIALNEQINELQKKLVEYEDEIPSDEEEEKALEDEEEEEELPNEEENKEENKRSINTMKKTKFNLINTINDVINNRSFNEVSAAVVAEGKEEMRKAGMNYSGQIVIPTESRDITVTNEHDDVVGIDMQSIMDALRAKTVLHEAGAKFLSDLRNDVVIPVLNAGNVAWAGETATASDAGETFKSVKLSPKRLTAFVDVSKQFLAQASEDAENMLRNDLIEAIAQKLEQTILGEADGSMTQPKGLFYSTGETTTISDFKGICNLEGVVEDANVNGNCVYIMSNKAKAELRAMSKGTKSTQLVYENGEVDGTKALNTSNVANKNIAYGDFSNLVIGQWSGLDVIIDQYSRAKDGVVRLVVNGYFDAAVVRDGAIAVGKIA